MTIVINKNTTKKEFDEKFKLLMNKKGQKGVNTLKFCGIITLKKHSLEIQKEMRDDWQ